MKYKLLIILAAFCFFSCKDKFKDKSKRNEDWAWWVDAKTGKANWIPVNKGDPVKNGKYTLFYFNGNLYSTGKLVDGIYADTVFFYDVKGKLLEYEVPKADSLEYYYRNGPMKLFYSDGKIKATGIIKNHVYGDKWSSFYRNGNPHYIKNFKNDTGWATRYYYNGKVEDSDYYEGAKGFNLKHWYQNGQLEHSSKFKNHNKNGKHLQYYENGQLQAIGQDSTGERNGEEKLWYEDGKLHSVSYRRNGLLNGTTIVYFENGKIQAERYDINGKVEGEAKRFDENGKLIVDRIFKGGVLIEDKLNLLISKMPVK